MSDNSSPHQTESQPADPHLTQADLERVIGGELEDLAPAPGGAPDAPGAPDPEEVFVAPEGTGPYADRDVVLDERTASQDE